MPIIRLSKNWRKELKHQLRRDPSAQNIVWAAKGIAPLDKATQFVTQNDPKAIIFLDLDDDDAGLAEAFAKRSLTNRLRLHPWRRTNPRRIRRSQHAIAQSASGYTFSSNALATVYPQSFQPSSRIPHVRTSTQQPLRKVSANSATVKFGSFGTLRPHKGSGLLLELMRYDRNMTLVTFENCGLGTPEPTDCNWVELESDTPLDVAYSHVDVSVIPITEGNSGAQFQLPAKLIDSLQWGTPVLATPTPAIEEIAEGAFTPLCSPMTAAHVAEQIRTLASSDDGRRGAARFSEVLTPQAAARELILLIDQAANAGGT
ncbi:glycosyltransferase [Pseudarthrobacter sp. NPDC058119]|uniref:glycosyltransferase n=1 Tax=Pseudarthrobacter sp. NPDC058119 TaxID=3346348 RepID=UPI0036D945DA